MILSKLKIHSNHLPQGGRETTGLRLLGYRLVCFVPIKDRWVQDSTSCPHTAENRSENSHASVWWLVSPLVSSWKQNQSLLVVFKCPEEKDQGEMNI